MLSGTASGPDERRGPPRMTTTTGTTSINVPTEVRRDRGVHRVITGLNTVLTTVDTLYIDGTAFKTDLVAKFQKRLDTALRPRHCLQRARDLRGDTRPQSPWKYPLRVVRSSSLKDVLGEKSPMSEVRVHARSHPGEVRDGAAAPTSARSAITSRARRARRARRRARRLQQHPAGLRGVQLGRLYPGGSTGRRPLRWPRSPSAARDLRDAGRCSEGVPRGRCRCIRCIRKDPRMTTGRNSV